MIKVTVHMTDRMIGENDEACRKYRINLRTHLMQKLPHIDELTITSEPSKSFVKVTTDNSLLSSMMVQREVYKHVVEYTKRV